MRTKEAEKIGKRVLEAMGESVSGKATGEPSDHDIAALLVGLAVNVARIADALTLGTTVD